MKIAVTAETNQGLESPVSYHFGRCAYYVFVEVVDGKVKEVTTIPNRHAEGHAPGELPAFIQQNKANVLLTGGMGRRAVEFFTRYGIEVVTGAQGQVGEAIQRYLAGELAGASPCQQSLEHSHGHHQQ